MGNEGAALGNDTDCIVEMAEEREELLLGALRDVEVVGDKEKDTVEFVWGKRGLESDGVECNAKELDGCEGAFGFFRCEGDPEAKEDRLEC